MKHWEELPDGRWKLSIFSDEPDDQTPPSVYRGTKEQIAEMLADSQANANRRIGELKRNGSTPTPNGHGPKPLTPAERMQTVAELGDPATAPEAITRVVESAMGETMEERRTRQQKEDNDALERAGFLAADSFVKETPEYLANQYNSETMFNYMRSQGMDPTNRQHYTLAFEKLTAAKLLQPKPSEAPTQEAEPEEEDERERNAPVPVPVPKAPTRVSTGVMSRDISGLPPRPTTRLKYSREQIAELGGAEYKRLMFADPDFSKCVEWYAQQDRQRQRRTG
jgi:hypothetical protein